jgi:hypothetical protein
MYLAVRTVRAVCVNAMTDRAVCDDVAGGVRGRRAMDVAGDAVELVAASIVSVASSTVTARESEERHSCHAGGAKNHAEYVEVHLFSSRKSGGFHFSEVPMQESPDD